ncbi:hypothetical protein D3C76_980970 [compost metagenome]
MAASLGETGRVTESHQLAIAPPGEIIQPVDLTPLRQNALAVQGQAQQVGGIAAVDRSPAGSHEGPQPAPLSQVQTWPQLQRRVAAQQPAQGLQRYPGIGQRRHIAVGQLPAIGKAGALGQALARFDQVHCKALAHQGIGCCQTDDAPTNDRYPLCHVLSSANPKAFRLGPMTTAG